MDLLNLALPLPFLIQKLSNLALQLGNLGLVAGIPLIQLFGHTVPVASLQCIFSSTRI
jgi:hypothetical protein